MNSYSNPKSLRFIITLGTGNFGSSKNNQIVLEGFRATASIDKAGGQMMGQLTATIHGVSLADMNSVTTVQYAPLRGIKNVVEVYAIDGTQETLIFAGNIITAWGNFQGQPDVYLQIAAQNAYDHRLTPVAPRSFKGQIDVATVLKSLADDMNYAFENTGVNVQLTDIYLHGTALDQVKAITQAANVWYIIDNGVLAITPPNVPRKGLVPVLAPLTGAKGYPTFDGVGINVECYFNPAIRFHGAFQLETDIPQARGQFFVVGISYNLQSETYGGAWFMRIRGSKVDLIPTI